MDKITNGFVIVPEGQEANVQLDIKHRYQNICLNEYGVKAKVKVELIPIQQVIENPNEWNGFTHAYKVRCRA